MTSHLETSTLYEEDYYHWLELTARQIRERDFNSVDWENLLEELDSLGRSEKNALKNRLILLLMHLLKYQYQREKRSSSWVSTILEQRRQINSLLEDSPSLKPYYLEIFAKCYSEAVLDASTETRLPVSTFAVDSPFAPQDVIDFAYIRAILEEDEQG
jgi:Domain of unknown function DUF29